MSNKKIEDNKMIGQEEDDTTNVSSGFDMIKTIIVSLIVCIAIVIVASIVFQPVVETVTEYEQLPVCSLNTIMVGQTYEVNGNVMILEDISQNYNKDDDLRLYFEKVE